MQEGTSTVISVIGFDMSRSPGVCSEFIEVCSVFSWWSNKEMYCIIKMRATEGMS